MLEKISNFGAKLGSQRHMVAIRDSFAATMPLVMAGAFAVLMNNVFFVPWSLLANFIGAESSFITWTNTNIAPLFALVDRGAFAILSLALVLALAYNLAKSYGEDGLSAGLIGVGAFFILGPLSRVSSVSGWVSDYLGAQGVFIALFVGIIAAEVFVRITKKGFVIKMPELVPPAVSRAFAAIIPGAVALLLFAIIAYIFQRAPFLAGEEVLIGEEMMETPASVFNWVEQNITSVLVKLLGGEGSGSVFGAVVASFISLFVGLFWSVGLHGANLLAPVMDSIYLPLATENAANYAAGLEATHVWVRSSWDIYVFLGGSGTTIALLGAIMFAGKKEEEREVAKLGVGAGAFQINEPVIFGLPIVLNPIYAIPFIVSQPILTFIAYMATSIGLVDPVVNITPWTTPPILSAYMATLDWKAAVLAIVNLAIAFFIYLPFVMASNKTRENK